MSLGLGLSFKYMGYGSVFALGPIPNQEYHVMLVAVQDAPSNVEYIESFIRMQGARWLNERKRVVDLLIADCEAINGYCYTIFRGHGQLFGFKTSDEAMLFKMRWA